MLEIPRAYDFPIDYTSHPEFNQNFQLVKEMPTTGLDFLLPRPQLCMAEQQLNFEDDQKLVDEILDISKPKPLITTPIKQNTTLEEMLKKTPFHYSVQKIVEKLNPAKIRNFYFQDNERVMSSRSRYKWNPKPPSYIEIQQGIPHNLRTVNQKLFISEKKTNLLAGVTDSSLLTSIDMKYLPGFATKLMDFESKTDLFSNQYLYKPIPPSYNYIFSQSQGTTQDSDLIPVRKNIEPTPKINKNILPLCIMYIEIFCRNRSDLIPNPKIDSIEFAMIKIRDDMGQGKELIYQVGNGFNVHRGKHQVKIFYVNSEIDLLKKVSEEMQIADPDVIVSYEGEKAGIGYLIKRSKYIFQDFISRSSRQQQFIVQQTYRYKKLSSHLPGRIILSCWRLIKYETHFYSYSIQNVLYSSLNIRFPSYSYKHQTFLFYNSRAELYDYLWDILKYSQQLIDHYGILERNVTLAQVYGIDYESVFTRGSQFRVEAMLKKQTGPNNFLLLSAAKSQVNGQSKLQSVPLVLEPPKKFWTDPIIVLDFQSLYPSIMIAYNLCYSTCLGKIKAQQYKKFGVTNMRGDVFDNEDIIITPNNVAFVKKNVRMGFIPVMMHELLQTRIMIKNSMKQVDKTSSRYHELFVQQLGIKLLCNTTYGYAGAGETGRMPCNDIADSIVSIGRETLEDAIRLVNGTEKWQAEVIYGDTDSMMVHLPGRTVEQAFLVGKEIAKAVTLRNPQPVELIFENVYFPMLTLAKKHYAGMKFEHPNAQPYFVAKGIETVRTDYCPLTSKILEGALFRIFQSRDISTLHSYLTSKWKKILSNRYHMKDFIMYNKVILSEYKNPPAAVKVSLKNMEIDEMRKPLFGENVGYIIRAGHPGEAVTDLAMNPEDFLASQEYNLNLEYYMDKQINTVLDRTFSPFGIDIKQWYRLMPKKKTPLSIDSLQPKKSFFKSNIKRIDNIFSSGLCIVCRKFVNGNLCEVCKENPQKTVLAVMACLNYREKKLRRLMQVCRACTGSLNEVLCSSLDCPIYYSKLKLQHESFTIAKRMENIQW